jgi:hypothetical protein
MGITLPRPYRERPAALNGIVIRRPGLAVEHQIGPVEIPAAETDRPLCRSAAVNHAERFRIAAEPRCLARGKNQKNIHVRIPFPAGRVNG